MPANIILLNPPRHFIANEAGLGYLMSLGLIMLGGPLIDAGHSVKLIDHDLNHWSIEKLIQEIADFKARYILLGHSGSTASHPIVVETVRMLRKAFPNICIIYGGVYPSYAFEEIMLYTPEIDVIVRGEGEQTIVDLIHAL